jgi:hypothetical protein
MVKDRETQSRQVAPRYSDPFGTLRSEMDRLFRQLHGGASNIPKHVRIRRKPRVRPYA